MKIALLGIILLLISCRAKKPVDFDEDLTQEQSGVRLSPPPMAEMDYPEFDYTYIIEVYEGGERIAAADLIDGYAKELDEYKNELDADQKVEIKDVVADLHYLAKQVRSKKIIDADELMSACIIVDKNIGEVFFYSAEELSALNDPAVLVKDLKASIKKLKAYLPKLKGDQKIIANRMLNRAQEFLKQEANNSNAWKADIIDLIDVFDQWFFKNYPEEEE